MGFASTKLSGLSKFREKTGTRLHSSKGRWQALSTVTSRVRGTPYNALYKRLRHGLEAMLTSGHPCEKLQCLCENQCQIIFP